MNMNPNMGMNMGMQMNQNLNMNSMVHPGMNPQMNMGMNMPPQNQFQGQFNATFISGKIGNKEIAKEDLPTFKSNLKETEWTQNPIYKNAKNADVQLTFNPKENRNNMPNFQRANIGSYLLDIGPYLSEFNNYANDCLSKNAKMADEVEQKKNEFIKSCFPSDASIDMVTMLEKIKKNRCYILSKDQQLYKKVEHYLPFLADDKPNNTNNNSNPILLNQVSQNINQINQTSPPSFGYQQQQNSQVPPQQYNNMNYGYNNPTNSIYGNNPPSNNIYGNISNRGYYQ